MNLECKYKFQDDEKFNGESYCCLFNEKCKDLSFACDKNCQVYEDFKTLVSKDFECCDLNAKLVYYEDRVGKLERALLRRNKEIEELKQSLLEIKETIEKRDVLQNFINKINEVQNAK